MGKPTMTMKGKRAILGAIPVVSGIALFVACTSGSNETNTEGADAGSDAASVSDVAPNAEASSADDASIGDGSCAAYDPPLVTTPIAASPDKTWRWVPLAGAVCRDGSPTGIAINRNSSSNNLMIFLEGGGQCFNDVTCAGNPKSFGEPAFENAFVTSTPGGVLRRADLANPVADWNFVFVPYCTGDNHGGNNPCGVPLGSSSPQQYVGYVDMELALARIVPSFPGVSKVLLAGSSAGGAGVPITYLQTARAFSGTPVYALDDSGPPMSSTYLPTCLQNEWATLWRYDRTVLADCGSACNPAGGNAALDLLKKILTGYPSSPFGVVDSMNDKTISALYAYGLNNCADLATSPSSPYDASTFAEGQVDPRTELAAFSNYGSFLFPGTDHTSLGDTAKYDTRTAGDGGVALTTWVSAFAAGTVTNVGP